jgi:WXG100 family type VII secretion target
MGGAGGAGGDVDDYTLDPDDLDDVVVRLEGTESALLTLAADLDKQMAVLKETWEGLAAQAHTEAHQEWAQGMAAMKEAMTDLRAAARIAHGNYLAAADANVTMWEGLT